MGWEVDLNYQLSLMKKSGLQAGYSVFRPGRFARRTRGPDNQHWAYVMLTVSF